MSQKNTPQSVHQSTTQSRIEYSREAWGVNNFTIIRQNFTKMSTYLLICTLFVNNYTYRYQYVHKIYTFRLQIAHKL